MIHAAIDHHIGGEMLLQGNMHDFIDPVGDPLRGSRLVVSGTASGERKSENGSLGRYHAAGTDDASRSTGSNRYARG